jgi:hypothetical protein
MPVSVQSNSLNLSPSAAHALLAVGGGKQTESSRHSPVDLHAADGRGEFLASACCSFGRWWNYTAAVSRRAAPAGDGAVNL